jgi:hypothetical protein
MSKYAWQYLIEGVIIGFIILGAISEYLWYRWEKENHLQYPKGSFDSVEEDEFFTVEDDFGLSPDVFDWEED